jgi:hypothetical protein
MIGGILRTITSALTHAIFNAGANIMAMGTTMATKECDVFTYLFAKSDGTVYITLSRIPYANLRSDFDLSDSSVEKYGSASTASGIATTDIGVVIGRFACTNSGSANYYWSVPTFTASNLIQRPIYETRKLTYLPTWAGWTNNTTTLDYKLIGSVMIIFPSGFGGTSNSATTTGTLPFAYGGTSCVVPIGVIDNSAWLGTVGRLYLANGSNAL